MPHHGGDGGTAAAEFGKQAEREQCQDRRTAETERLAVGQTQTVLVLRFHVLTDSTPEITAYLAVCGGS